MGRRSPIEYRQNIASWTLTYEKYRSDTRLTVDLVQSLTNQHQAWAKRYARDNSQESLRVIIVRPNLDFDVGSTQPTKRK
jgi:hypothetical protein